MRFILVEILFLLVLTSTLILLAQDVSVWENQLKKDPKNTELLLELGRYYHELAGNENDNKAFKKADNYLTQLLKLDPENRIALVYYGSLMTVKAREENAPWKSLEYLNKGFLLMDKAVHFEPENPEIRLIRGINSTSVPDEFSRLSLALEDFKVIKGRAEEITPEVNEKFWLNYYFYYGLALIKAGKHKRAKTKLEKVIEIAPESDFASRAKEKLSMLEE